MSTLTLHDTTVLVSALAEATGRNLRELSKVTDHPSKVISRYNERYQDDLSLIGKIIQLQTVEGYGHSLESAATHYKEIARIYAPSGFEV